MKERPILFNAEMVRAILDGRKTQTRRVISEKTLNLLKMAARAGECHPIIDGDPIDPRSQSYCWQFSPLGKPGDRLWVRETWGVVSQAFNDDGFRIPWTPQRPATPVHELPFGNGYYSGHVIYRADGGFIWSGDDDGDGERTAWHPSIHMPRKTSRIDLLITGVRVERLQSITHEDAEAEGIHTEVWDQTVVARSYAEKDAFFQFWSEGMDHYVNMEELYRESYRTLWESIYGAGSWNANPWVWVVEFERVGAE